MWEQSRIKGVDSGVASNILRKLNSEIRKKIKYAHLSMTILEIFVIISDDLPELMVLCTPIIW